ncbi:alpha/beta hydrolase family protein [Mycetocola reblochoni]|nr:alpha/beta hydrolase [Mycetocola reblochoni]
MMKPSSHAAKRPAVLVAVLAGVAGIVLLPLIAAGALVSLMSRRIVRPEPGRAPDVAVVAVETGDGATDGVTEGNSDGSGTPHGSEETVAGQGQGPGMGTVTLSGGPETTAPGRYSLIAEDGTRYLVGDLVRRVPGGAVRALLGTPPPPGPGYRLSAYYYSRPDDAGVTGSLVDVPTPLGPMPAWLVPAGDGRRWAVVVHGRGALREEGLRSAPIWAAHGITALYVSYRNDPDGIPSRDGRYGLGSTEWRDVDAAIGYARTHGATEVILMGWSMGGAISFQTLLHGSNRELITGMVLDSPVVDWTDVIRFQATLNRLPRVIGAAAARSLGRRAATRQGPDIAAMDMLRRADEIDVPVLILHSTDDGFVPAEPSARLAELRPELVTTHLFANATHTRIWNDQPERWRRIIDGWLDSTGLGRPGPAATD